MNDNPLSQFVAFYPDALLYLSRLNDIEAIGVLFALSKRANRFGGCDPGDSDLSALSGHRRDAIPAILGRLQAIDYIHIIETSVAYRLKPLRGYQVSPYVLRLGIDNQASAIAEWHRFNLQTNAHNEKQTSAITFPVSDQQPESESEPESKPASKPDSEPATDQPASINAEGVIRAKAPLKGEGQGQGQAQEQGAARTELATPSETRASALSAPPPPMLPPQWEPKHISQYKRPLPVEDDENVALDMVSMAGDLSRENARMLVDTYGFSWCEWVMGLLRKNEYSVEHPARWMRAMLRKTTTELKQREG